MFDLIANVLSFLYDINNSYVVAIVLLTLIVLVIATPLTLSGTKSMLKMQLLQPELKAIQDKYGKDQREEMNQEMMEFYKDNQINPVGGCVPLLFQIPVFLVLYRVIIGITRRATPTGIELGEVVGSLRAGTEPTIVETDELLQFNPAYVSEDSALYQNLSETNVMESIGFDLARSASQVLGDGIIPALPYLALVLIVGGSGWIQHRMIRSRNSGAAANPTQEMIMKYMPFFLPIFAFTLPAAIVFYFLMSNLYRIGQQAYITRSFYSGDDSLGAQVRTQRESSPQDKKNDKKNAKSANATSAVKKTSASKSTASKKKKGQGGSGANGGKSGKKKKAPASAGAPGRNVSGRNASARASVEPKARKKKR